MLFNVILCYEGQILRENEQCNLSKAHLEFFLKKFTGHSTAMSHDEDLIKRHYNMRPNRSVHERKYTRNINIRNINNYVKNCLIMEFIRPNDRVLDIGVGKGGDLKKYHNAGVAELYGVDIANRSILDATARARDYNYRMKMIFKTKNGLTAPLQLCRTFDVVSIQFAFHYAFSSAEHLQVAIQNISSHLHSGGYVLITIPSKDEILHRVSSGRASNTYYEIKMKTPVSEALYGNSYLYSLVDSLDRCIEYLVDIPELTKRMEEADMKLVTNTPFPRYIDKQRIHREGIYRRMCRRELNNEEWDVVSLHNVIVFRKN